MNMLRLFLAMAVVGVVGCRKNDYRVLEFRVPEMKNEACAEIVREAINSTVRIKVDRSGPRESPSAKAARERALSKMDIEIDLESRTVRLWYDSIITAQKNIEYQVAEAGFRVETQSRGETIVIPANKDTQEKLPEACRSLM
jgi:copper chaperone CopZ